MSDTWNEDDLEYRVGTSFLAEFAAGHTAADVIRELIQNEYDAGGSTVDVEFGETELRIRGNGKAIDRNGWSRLSVMVGTGTVAGTDSAVAAKVNGIGSKNFGLRSLFLFGDRISIRSAGRQTVLDRRKGTLPSPVEDAATRGTPGVLISVGYRSEDDGDLHAFTPEREADAFRDIARIVGPSVVKLALPKGTRRIDKVSIRSHRLGRTLELEQSAKVLDRRGTSGRTVRLRHDGWDPGDIRARYSEVEYTRALSPPPQFADRDVPSYFRLPGGRIRIGVSFALERGRLASSPGIFYYPLGAVRAHTGALFSVSAPFAMNDDRSQLLDAGSNEWNRWLLAQAADYAVSLVPETLFEQYGANAYVAVSVDPDHASAEVLAEDVRTALTDRECWPSRERSRGRPRYRRAAELTVPIPELRDIAGSLRSDSVVSEEIANNTIASDLAVGCNAKPFDTNSLVRFRCAGPDATELQTKASGAQWFYTNFPDPWRDLNRQASVAEALDRVRSRLTPANRADLAESPTTLTRSGDLAAPSTPLWVVDPLIEDAVPSTTALHPDLAKFKVIRSLCKPFELSQWVVAIAEAAADGSIDEKSLVALRRLLLTLPELSRSAWKALRQSPVLVDQRGQPSAPEELIVRTAPGATLLEPTLRFAPVEVARVRELVDRLRIRSEVRGADLVALAEAVEAGDVAPAVARLALQRHGKFLTPQVVKRLREIAFLELTNGARAAPSRAYERNARTIAALGSEHPWPSAEYGSLTARLRCSEDPRAEDILARLRELQSSDTPLPQAELVYRLLHEAAKSERQRLTEYSNEQILWTGDRWCAPRECLFGSEFRALFGDALPVLSRQRDALVALGVPTRPTVEHWTRLFEYAASFANRGLSRRLRDAVLAAYNRLDALPEAIPTDLPVLLDESGRLHSLDDASNGALVINDDPVLADAVRAANLPIAFAHPDPASTSFLYRSGVARLSERSRLESVTPGEAAEDVEFRSAPKLLARFADSDFASAAAALGDAICGVTSPRRSTSLPDRLMAIQAIDVVHSIERRHRIGTHTVTTHVDHFVDTDRIVVTHVRTQDDLRRAVARAVATIIDPADDPDRLLPDATYFLLGCATRRALARELAQRRIPWHVEDADEEGLTEDETPDDEEDRDSDADAVGDAISGAIKSGAGVTPTAPTPAPTSRPAPVPASTPRELPPLKDVSPSFSTSQPKPSPRGSGGSGGGAPSGWAPRSPQQVADDQRLGERGEQIVFDLERRRVAARGQNPNEVIWVSKASPAANYDIRSIDERGREIWIEVKATVGRSGRFSWPKSEFLLAVAKRRRYFLHRVYEADTVSPKVVEIQDPFARFESGQLTIDLDTLSADIGSLPE